jgi:hypothetical protein
MKRGLAVALGTCALMAAGSASAELSIGAGFEGFRWKESTSPTVKENGLRWVLDLTWSQSRAPGPSVAYNVKTYVGNVDYTGALLVSGTPISGETHYRGIQNEFQTHYRMTNGFGFMLAFGWDHWRRELSQAQEEEWNILYARAGVAYEPVRTGIIGSAGVKYPVHTRENARFNDLGFTTNPHLRPGKDWSLYGTLGYRVNANWDILAYYDSFRFKQSNIVAVVDGAGNSFGAFQPKSRQDQLGLKVQHTF